MNRRQEIVEKALREARDKKLRSEENVAFAKTQKMRRLGPYVLLGELGSGPTGVVYLGTHLEFNKPSAIKVLRKRFEGDVESILTPFRAAMKLDHPNIAAAHSVHQVRDRVYIASEYVKGSPITSFSLSVEQSLKVMIKVAGAIGAAHHAGVVHGVLVPLDEDPPRHGRLLQGHQLHKGLG